MEGRLLGEPGFLGGGGGTRPSMNSPLGDPEGDELFLAFLISGLGLGREGLDRYQLGAEPSGRAGRQT